MKQLLLGTIALASAALLPAVAGGDALAARAAEDSVQQPVFSYSAAFTCGLDPPNALNRVLPGRFASAVILSNPNAFAVAFQAKVSLAFPGSAPVAGPSSPFIDFTLGPNEAMELDCEEVPTLFFPPGTGFPPYQQGVVQVQSPSVLDVSTVHTTGAIDAGGNVLVSGIDVQNVPERRLRAR